MSDEILVWVQVGVGYVWVLGSKASMDFRYVVTGFGCT